MPYSARNPKQMTFREVFSEFGKGTLSSSSPASRRGAYMAFSPHRKRSQSAPRKRVAKVGLGERFSSFDRMHSVLVRSHFTALFTALHEEGLCDGPQYAQLLSVMKRVSWESHVLPAWLSRYAEFATNRDAVEFVGYLISHV